MHVTLLNPNAVCSMDSRHSRLWLARIGCSVELRSLPECAAVKGSLVATVSRPLPCLGCHVNVQYPAKCSSQSLRACGQGQHSQGLLNLPPSVSNYWLAAWAPAASCIPRKPWAADPRQIHPGSITHPTVYIMDRSLKLSRTGTPVLGNYRTSRCQPNDIRPPGDGVPQPQKLSPRNPLSCLITFSQLRHKSAINAEFLVPHVCEPDFLLASRSENGRM